MNSKTQFYVELSNQASKDITASVQSWMSFLSTAARCSRYSYADQLMIHAQYPGATACAEYEVWRDVMNRFVYKGEKGIALIDYSGDYPRLRYVFDVSQTGARAYSRDVKLFTPEDVRASNAKERIARLYSLRDMSLETTLVAAAGKRAEEYWEEHGEEFLDIIAGSTFRGYDEIDIAESFKNMVENSVSYQLLERCTGDGKGYFNLSDFQEIPFFNTRSTIAALGTAINQIAGEILEEITRAIREHEREQAQSAERSTYGTDIQGGRDGITATDRDEREGQESAREVREDAQALPAGAQTDDLREHEAGREPVPALVGGAGDSDEPSGADDGTDVEEIAGTGQDDQSDGMGKAHERPESTGGGDDPLGADLQLEPVTEFQQLSLFQAIRTERAAEEITPPAFSLPEDDLDNDLLRGSLFEGGKMRIYALYQHEINAAERAKFLQKEYGLSGHSHQLMNGESGFVEYSGKGVLIHSFRSDFEVRYTWREAERRIKRLIDAGVYLNDRDREKWAALEEKYAAVGGVPYPDPAYRMPEPEGILKERESAVAEEVEHLSGEVIEDYQVGDVITLDGTDFIIDEVREHEISMRDPRLLYPLFRVESRENLKKLREQEVSGIREEISPMESLAEALDGFSFDHDYYNYQDYVNDRENHVREITETLGRGEDAGYRAFLTDFIEESEDESAVAEAKALLQRLDEVIPEEPIRLQETVIQISPTEAPEAKEELVSAGNYHITNDDLGAGGPKEKFRRNMDAVHLLKRLESEERKATREEQEILSQYVGWGGIQEAFDEKKDAWASEYRELKVALTEEEYEAARATVLNAHYTSPTVIRGIYDALERMGFKTGNILEPSMGTGNFFGMLPENMQGSRLYGVELDSITGRIAQYLYPEAQITVAGFETTDRRDFYDLAIGNVPFGTYKVNDRPYNKLGFNIHNYFFAKALDQVRPGGVVAFVTSRYTMDSASPEVRKYLAERAELLGAIRLPNNAFRANAGTDVVSDIIFLQKREHPIEVNPDWVHRGVTEDGLSMNSYFIDHPEMVLGDVTTTSTQYGREDLTVAPKEGVDLKDLLAEAVKHIEGEYHEAEAPAEEVIPDRESIPADPDVKNFSYTVVDGQVYFRENSLMYPVEKSETEIDRIRGMIGIRQTVNDLITYQMEDYPDEQIAAKQDELNTRYDAFVKKHGLINHRSNARAFSEDSSYYLLCSLEDIDEDGKLKGKADMFTKRTIRPERVITSVDTPSEALAVSIGERGKVDLAYMSELLGTPGDYGKITESLTGIIFKDPLSGEDETEGWQTADEYLSGNVREKLKIAVKMVEQDARFQPNVDALTKVQPKDLDASEIDVQLGATWIDRKYIHVFMHETFETPFYLTRAIDVQYSPVTAAWRITGKTKGSASNVAAHVTYGTDRANAYHILEDTLNLKDVRIYDTIEDAEGNKKRVLNKRETTLAAQKQQAIKDAFRDWVWKDPDRRQALVQKYNEMFNSTRPREYDGSHIRFVGMNPDIELRPHQINAIAHVLYGQNTLLAHEVGAGKTFEMAASAMEAKRLGLCQKSLFVVPNHLTEQWASDFLRLYPSAKILVARKKDFETKNRKKFCARIATGDYDAVIIGHSQFEKIPVSFERQERLLNEQIEEIEGAIAELKFMRGESFTIKQMEQTRKTLQTKLQKLLATERKDDVIDFEQLGVDRLFVDEAHYYKNLFLYTKMRNVAGLSTSEAQKSSDMFMKTQYMDEITGGRGTVFATGTPVSNSMTEMYTMMRYLQYGTLKAKELTHFDCWASTFGQTTTSIELAPEGTGYRARTRFAKFFNLPELMSIFKEVADVKTHDQMDLDVPDAEFETVLVKPSGLQKEMVQALSERAAAVHAGQVDPSVDNMLKITSDGRKIGLDQRLMNPMLPDDPGSKLNACVENVFRIWEDGKEGRLTQLLFCDMSTPKADGSFNVYDDIKQKLIARGVPENEIAFIHNADSDAKKKDLFSKVRSGQVRVLLGSTQKMGAGTNVQDRLIAVHHLDVGWRPADMTQRNGRIIRYGNNNKKVQVYQYVTEGTFDAYLYQTLENKQRFISQIMTSKSPVRSCEDVDEQVLSYAEVKALCAGNPQIKEKMDLDIEVARLKVLKADHQSKQYRLEDQLIQYFPLQIEKQKGFIRGYEKDMETSKAHPVPEEGFCGMEIKGSSFSEKKDAGEVLLSVCKQHRGDQAEVIGTYRGFQMELSFDAFDRAYKVALKGQMTHSVTLGQDAFGNITRLDNAIAGIEKRLQGAKDHLGTLLHDQENAQAEVGKPFPQEEELRVKSVRLAELDTLLNMDEQGAEPIAGEDYGAMEEQEVKPSINDALLGPDPPHEAKEKKPEEVVL